MVVKTSAFALTILGSLLGMATPANAEMVLSQVIVDLLPGRPAREDIEVFNSGTERMYVLAEPFEIQAAGSSAEQRVPVKDPEEAGLLVSPQRLVLEPGERRMIRVAALGDRPTADRIYRMAIRPVAGSVSAETSALKVYVGYDALVILRPEQFTGDLEVMRAGKTLLIRNNGNTAQELFDGKQCNTDGGDCRDLPAKRIYPGSAWGQTLPFDTPASYRSAVGPDVRERRF